MQPQTNIIDCYNKTAKTYAAKFIDELDKKHLDRILLKAFALENSGKGRIIDVGCGPGQATKYLSACGATDLLGVDIASSMIEVAKNINPTLNFETADILNLKYLTQTFGAAIAFYAIVHFDYTQVKIAFEEIKRILVANGHFLFSFHIGDHIVHLNDFLEQPVTIDFHFFETSKIVELLVEVGFDIIDIIERQPYSAVEYPSQRAYIWAKASNC